MRFLLCFFAVAAPLFSAQAQTIGRDTVLRSNTLTLEEAISVARRNNYLYLESLSQRQRADASVRSAYGQLLPQADASFTGLRQQGGRQIFNGGSFGASSDVNQSQYRLGLSYRINSATLITPSVQRANRDAVEADISASGENLRTTVVQQYLTVLQAQARAELQDTLVSTARSQVVLAQARALVGSGTQLDISRAEVALGQQQVQQLQARNTIEIEKLRLFQDMGIQKAGDVKLTTDFTIAPLSLSLDQLLETARKQNPTVLALRSREHVAALNVKREKGEYTPTLTLSTGLSGYTYAYTDPNYPVAQARSQMDASRASCIRSEEVRAAVGLSNGLAQCNALVLTDATAATLRKQNSQFPFDFTTSPKSISATLSLPIFDGFAREQRVQEAQVSRSNLQNQVRATEIELTSGITGAYLSLNTAQQTVALQEQNSAKARLELKLMQDRYRAGQATFVDLSESQAAYERAESDRINAIYDYHNAFALLENAVGRPLR
jgi:outer membrane protein